MSVVCEEEDLMNLPCHACVLRALVMYAYACSNLSSWRCARPPPKCVCSSRASNEFNTIVSDPLMRNSAILIFANKQDMKGALNPAEVCEQLGVSQLRDRTWHVQGTVATKGEGLYEGLDWLCTMLRHMQRSGQSTSVNNAPPPPR